MLPVVALTYRAPRFPAQAKDPGGASAISCAMDHPEAVTHLVVMDGCRSSSTSNGPTHDSPGCGGTGGSSARPISLPNVSSAWIPTPGTAPPLPPTTISTSTAIQPTSGLPGSPGRYGTAPSTPGITRPSRHRMPLPTPSSISSRTPPLSGEQLGAASSGPGLRCLCPRSPGSGR
jgi:hypothetical protein